MESESLEGLGASFKAWRSNKRYRQEAIPAALMERARSAARRHGASMVARVTKVDIRRLSADNGSVRSTVATAVQSPTFSRFELGAPSPVSQPFAELEMATGLKVRLFWQSNEVVELLSSLLSVGGGQ